MTHKQTLALCREALILINETMKVYVREREKLIEIEKEALRELRSRMIPSVEEIIKGGGE